MSTNVTELELEKRIKELSEQYYMFGNSDVSDEEFDDLVETLRNINPSNKILSQVGFGISLSGIDDKEKFTHPLPMGSIDKEKSLDKARSFCDYFSTFSTKIDGNSVAAYYREGKLWKVVTRGKDDIGIDRTAKFVKILPPTIPLLGYVRVRGEAAIKKSNYIVENGFDLSKSSRNAVAGAISRKTDWESVFKYVDFIAYTFNDCDNGLDLYEQLKWERYFNVEKQKNIKEFLTSNIEEIKTKYKDNYEYDSDGIVLKNGDDLLAFKFEDESVITDLLDIRWTVGKDQRMTPTAIVSTVNLAGASISKASFGSFSKVLEKDCWPIRKIHKVKIIRANEIIPHIVDTTFTSDEEINQSLPKCPHCNSEGVLDGEHIFCKNENCPNIENTRLYNFSSNFYVDGLGDSVMEKVFDSLSISTVEELINFKGKFNKYIDGIGDSTIDKVNKFLDNIKQGIDVRIIYKTFINNCGDRASNKIVESDFDIVSFVNGGPELLKLYKIDNFDSGIIDRINKSKTRFKTILDLVELKQEKKAKVSGTYCITGARFSKEEVSYFLSKGWGEDDNIKTTTTILVVKDKSKKSGKIDKAIKYSIKIMDIQEFKSFVG